MVKFYRGLKANYAAATTHQDGIYFATDTKELLMNGNAYGIPYEFDASSIEGRLDVLEGNSSTAGSVAYQIAQIVAGADASFDTLKEIADWILSDTTGAAKMASDISALQTAVANIDYSDKADKVSGAVSGNFASLDANGNLEDSGKNGSSFELAGAVSTAIAGLDSTASQSAGADGLALSITETDGKITAISGSIAANTYEAYGAASTAIAALDVTKSQTAGADGLALSITETDGLISSISGSIAANTYDAYGAASSAQSAAESHADGLLAWIEVAA